MRISGNLPANLLTDRRALIAGGTGSVGRVVAEAFLASGATVVVPSRSSEKLTELRGQLSRPPAERLITIEGDVSNERDGARVREEVLERVGPLDAVVASLGGFVAAPSVLAAPKSDLQRVLDGYLLAHFMVAKALLPTLKERSGSYTFINGPLAFDPLFPGAGLVSVATAGQAMLARAVMKEEARGPARVNELVLYTRFGWEADEQERGPVSQADVARFLAHLASDAGTDVRGETIHLNSQESLRALAGEGAPS